MKYVDSRFNTVKLPYYMYISPGNSDNFVLTTKSCCKFILHWQCDSNFKTKLKAAIVIF